MTVGQRIRQVRKARRLTQKQLADLAGVSFSMVGSYERDKVDPTLFAITCIADVLGVSLDWIAGRETVQ